MSGLVRFRSDLSSREPQRGGSGSSCQFQRHSEAERARVANSSAEHTSGAEQSRPANSSVPPMPRRLRAANLERLEEPKRTRAANPSTLARARAANFERHSTAKRSRAARATQRDRAAISSAAAKPSGPDVGNISNCGVFKLPGRPGKIWRAQASETSCGN